RPLVPMNQPVCDVHRRRVGPPEGANPVLDGSWLDIPERRQALIGEESLDPLPFHRVASPASRIVPHPPRMAGAVLSAAHVSSAALTIPPGPGGASGNGPLLLCRQRLASGLAAFASDCLELLRRSRFRTRRAPEMPKHSGGGGDSRIALRFSNHPS